MRISDWSSDVCSSDLSLQEYGYSLLGGRLLPGPSGPAAQFMYEDASGQRLTLYITAANTPAGAKGQTKAQAIQALHEVSGQSTYYWVDHGMGYALSGQKARNDLRARKSVGEGKGVEDSVD